MEILNFAPDQFKIFLLILIRVSVVLYLFPIFESPMIPPLVKAGLALILTLALFPVVRPAVHQFPAHTVGLLILILTELFVGMVLGLSVRIFFAAVQLAGEMVGFQMGFSIVSAIDPQSSAQVSIIDQIGSMVALVMFLVLNGHHTMIAALAASFEIVEMGQITLRREFLGAVITVSADMFILAVKIGAPAIGALLFTSAAFGICARFVPQMNVMVAAFPVKIAVGLLFFGMTLKIIALMTRSYLNGLERGLLSILNGLGGG